MFVAENDNVERDRTNDVNYRKNNERPAGGCKGKAIDTHDEMMRKKLKCAEEVIVA